MSTPPKSISESDASKHDDERISWEEFLESQPPCQTRPVSDLLDFNSYLVFPRLHLYCVSPECQGRTFFDGPKTDDNHTGPYVGQDLTPHFLLYRCRHCLRNTKLYALLLSHPKDAPKRAGEAIKLGEWPPFGPHIPTKMFSLLGDDQETFHKGRRSESQGLGVGAFAYYRRVVENQKNRLIDEIIKVSKTLGAQAAVIANLEAARKETQFKKAVEIIKEGIPDALRISGQNPLSLLHTALSDGLHEQSDEECLARAAAIRLVLADLSERIVEVLKDHKELDVAVSKLMQIQTAAKTRVPATKADSSLPSNAAPAKLVG